MPRGGVVPEIAARHHLDAIEPIVHRALEEAGVSLEQIGGIAVTCGPGLVDRSWWGFGGPGYRAGQEDPGRGGQPPRRPHHVRVAGTAGSSLSGPGLGGFRRSHCPLPASAPGEYRQIAGLGMTPPGSFR